MMLKQRTIAKPAVLTGIGLHSGVQATVTFKPAKVNEGIIFIRTDLPGRPVIRLNSSAVVMDRNISRCTVIEENGARVSTIEHLLAALSGLGIDNVVIEIDALEAPGMDGSSRHYVEALRGAGLVELANAKEVIVITAPIIVENNGSSVMIVPADDFSVHYHMDYDHPLMGDQRFSLTVNEQNFIDELAGARTFCLAAEADAIRSAGLGKGANSQNTLIMGEHGPIDNQLRFSDECCRHKALDIVGDLYTLGVWVRGAVHGFKSGHALNRLLVEKIQQQWNLHMTIQKSSQRVFDIDDIKNILPHRYPFLFVDRVIEVECGVKGIGIKNVTANDGFFQGHFPQKPVMPGVIMIEAMAQTAGVVVLTSGKHDGKVALFMAVDEVKFRKVVSPGDQLMMEVEILRDRERTAQVKGVGRVDGEIVVEAMMVFSYTDIAYLTN